MSPRQYHILLSLEADLKAIVRQGTAQRVRKEVASIAEQAPASLVARIIVTAHKGAAGCSEVLSWDEQQVRQFLGAAAVKYSDEDVRGLVRAARQVVRNQLDMARWNLN